MSIQEKIEEAKAEGRKEAIREFFLSVVANGKSVSEIAEFYGLSEDFVSKIISEGNIE